MSTPLIIAHRGASAVAPENTLAAFTRAIKDGAEGIEFDVRLAKDGVPVVHHDETLERTGGRKERICDLTSGELKRADVGSWFRRSSPESWKTAYGRARVPTLAETLRHLDGFDGRLYIELKCDDTGVESLVRRVGELIRDSPIAPSIVVKSFRLGFIPHMRAACPDIRTAALFAPKIMTILRKEKHLVDIAREFGAAELSVHYSLMTKKLMKEAAKHGLPVTIWTADQPRLLRRGIKLGVNAIITNDPARLLAKRAEALRPFA